MEDDINESLDIRRLLDRYDDKVLKLKEEVNLTKLLLENEEDDKKELLVKIKTLEEENNLLKQKLEEDNMIKEPASNIIEIFSQKSDNSSIHLPPSSPLNEKENVIPSTQFSQDQQENIYPNFHRFQDADDEGDIMKPFELEFHSQNIEEISINEPTTTKINGMLTPVTNTKKPLKNKKSIKTFKSIICHKIVQPILQEISSSQENKMKKESTDFFLNSSQSTDLTSSPVKQESQKLYSGDETILFSSQFDIIKERPEKFHASNVDIIEKKISKREIIDMTFNPLTGKRWIPEDFKRNENIDEREFPKLRQKVFQKIMNKISDNNKKEDHENDEDEEDEEDEDEDECRECKKLEDMGIYGMKLMSPQWDSTQKPGNHYKRVRIPCNHSKVIRKRKKPKPKKTSNEMTSISMTPVGLFRTEFPNTQQLAEEKIEAKRRDNQETVLRFLSAIDIRTKNRIYKFRNKLFDNVLKAELNDYDSKLLLQELPF